MFALGVAAGCRAGVAPGDPDREARLVYGAVVDAEGREPVLLDDRLFTMPSLGGYYGDEFAWFATELPPISRAAYDAFLGVAFSLEAIPTPMPVGAASEVQLTSEAGDDVLISVSRVGFDKGFEHAVLATKSSSACAYFDVCSSEALHSLRSEDGVWIHEGSVTYLWID